MKNTHADYAAHGGRLGLFEFAQELLRLRPQVVGLIEHAVVRWALSSLSLSSTHQESVVGLHQHFQMRHGHIECSLFCERLGDLLQTRAETCVFALASGSCVRVAGYRGVILQDKK